MTYQSQFLQDPIARVAVQACAKRGRVDQVHALAGQLALESSLQPMSTDRLRASAAYWLAKPVDGDTTNTLTTAP